MVNAQQWLDANYPDKERTTVIYIRNWELYPRGEGLSGNLDLRNYKNLEELDLFANNITSLDLRGLNKLRRLWIGCNELKEIDLTDQKESLTHFHIGDNNFPEQDLSVFSNLINLQDLRVGGYERNLSSENIFNRFKGNLKPLKNMRKLNRLHIENTNIDSGLEYLPKSVENFEYGDVANAVRLETRGSNKFRTQLAPYKGSLQAWRKDNQELIAKVKSDNKSVEVQLSLKEIPSKYWDRVEVGDDWDKEYVKAENDKSRGWGGSGAVPMMDSYGIDTTFNDGHSDGPWDRRFKNQKILDGFKKYAETSFLEKPQHDTHVKPHGSPSINDLKVDGWARIHEPSKLTKSLRDANKLFVKNGHGKVTSQEAFEFLQSIIESREIKATVKLTQDEYEKLLGKETKKLTVGEQKEKGQLKEKKRPTEKSQAVTKSEGIKIAPIIPPQWQDILKKESKLDEKYDDIKEVSYELIYEERPSVWITNNEPLPLEKLPIRLYNVEEEHIEDIKKDTEVENYATLSYVWGGDYNTESGELSPGGKKSLKKAVEACNYLGIKHLWIDQLCINQNDWKEKAQEVPKMRQYYNNSTVTLVSIQKNILDDNDRFPSLDEALKSIISSEWFTRSWTFQEGWLSKQTIFMFDDALVDGRTLASTWALQQPSYSEHGKYNNLQEFSQGVKKIATPLGWVHYKGGYNSEDKMSLSLNQALRSIKERKRSLAIDGVYSILGLLPYGDNKEIKVDYSLSTQEALKNVMKIAVQEGYGEPLSWYGSGDDWMPDIDNVGSAKVLGGISIDYVPRSSKFIKQNGIEISGTKCIVENLLDDTSNEIKEGFSIEGGIYKRNILIKFANRDNEYIKRNMKLLGTSESLERVKKSDILLIPNREEWKSNKSFAILVSRKGSRYHRIGLVEFYWESGTEKLEGLREEKLMIGLNTMQQGKDKQEAQVQVPPKGNN